MPSIPMPIDADDLANRFTYHPPQAGQPQLYEEIRRRALDYAQYLVQVCPPGRDTSLAITHLEDVVFRANAAIARATPRDELLGLPKSSDFPPVPPTEKMPGRFTEPPRTDIPLRTDTTLGPPAAGTGG